jgi:hypothetical protein
MMERKRCSATLITNGVNHHPQTWKAWNLAQRNEDDTPVWDVDWKKVAFAMLKESSNIESQLNDLKQQTCTDV